ncbi:type I secretion system permease/ATPase [Trichloromonas sp.]|uniref:type I secretion system permease/ATPase n=1 Tax=Trichloromonas sp. TaxID=3069249 RepID=UPI002A3AA4CC|nr:type I secretion system permease/ATPase [Trichloromonas sp.]
MKNFFKQWRPYLVYGALFSMFINILQLTFPIYMLQIYDRVLSSYSLPTLYAITVAAVVSLVVMAALEFVRSRLLVRCGVAIDQVLSRDVLESVLKEAALTGASPNQATLRDVNLLRNFFGGNAIFTLFDIPWTPLFLTVIYILHPLLGLVATGGAVLLVVFALINEKVTRKPLDAANTVSGFSMKFVEAARRNAQTVHSMGMVNGVASRWSGFNDTVTKLQTQASRQAGLVQSLSSWLRQSMQVFIYGVGAWLTLNGEATAGCMIAASIIMGKALAPVQLGIGSWKSMVEARGAWRRLDALFSQVKSVEGMDLPEPKGQLAAEHVSFAIQGNFILRDINFSLEPGESLGLIGPSGAGKSTLCRLLLGIWPPSGGKVRLDGADIFSWQQEKLGPYLGYLSQDIELFSGTVAENIARLGEVDSEKVIAAAKQAGVHDLILNLPKGYDTRIGEGGQVLSGGQRQRIGLARALYKQPRLVILDEPNSNLDEEGEAALVRSFSELKKQGTTLVIVSHKPALLAGVDKVLMLKNGQLALFGPRNAVFSKLMESQGQGRQQVAG